MKKYIFSLLLALIWNIGYSQDAEVGETPSSIKKLEQLAKETFENDNYTQSIRYHKILDSLIPDRPEIKYNIGVCYLNSKYKYKALPYIEFAKKKKLDNPDLNYMLGQAYHHNHRFDEAKKSLREYLSMLKKDTTGESETIMDVEHRIQVCDFAKAIVADSIPVEIENIGTNINTDHDEYVPIVSADQNIIYFTSRKKSQFSTKIAADGKYFEDIYYSEKDTAGNWGPSKVCPAPLNSVDHDACIGMSADAQTIYLFRVKSSDPYKGDIYMSKLKGTTWTKPTPLGSHVNSKKGWETSVTITSDNKRLYFSSDREGGEGGIDIWYADWDDNEWGEAKNCGPSINTKYDEDSPFIHTDGKTLFFSSEGHNSMGGFDVFTSVMTNGAWSRPRNIGYPINSTDDDMYFVYSADGTKGYMSTSLRTDTKGARDIYVINRPKHSKQMIVVDGAIIDDETNKPIEATITVTNLQTNEVVGVYNSNSETGKYVLAMDFGKNYSVQFEAENFIFYSENVNISDPQAIFSATKSFKLKHIKPGNTLTLNNIFFDFNKDSLKTESLPELDKLVDFMQKHPHIYIQVGGHTDSIGTFEVNKKLSRKRAKRVVDYLVARGIPDKSFRIEGFGSTKPVAKNNTEEGRHLNRRTECLIYDMDSIPKEHIDHIASKDTTNDDDFVLEEIAGEKKIGATLLPTVHFLYNNGIYITEFSKTQINRVCEALKRVPSMKLEVRGSTDVVGLEYNNKSLYETRTNTILQLFAEKGFPAERFVVIPFTPSATPKVADLKKGDADKRKVSFALSAF